MIRCPHLEPRLGSFSLFVSLTISCLLSAPLVQAAQKQARLPLSGVPLLFDCEAHLSPSSPLLRPKMSGADISSLGVSGDTDPSDLVSDRLCSGIWKILQDAGAHTPHPGLSLPATASLRVRLIDDLAESTIQTTRWRDGTSYIQYTPRWSLETYWEFEFTIQTDCGHQPVQLAEGARGVFAGPAYAPLELPLMLDQNARSAFGALPSFLTSEGGLSNLTMSHVERPESAPPPLKAPPELSEAFWLLMVHNKSSRHGALAMLLGSEALAGDARSDLARWYLLHDPDSMLRIDALKWLFAANSEEGRLLGATEAELLRWVLYWDPSFRVRQAAVEVIAGLGGDEVIDLLFLAAMDPKVEVADLASSYLRRGKAPTSELIDSLIEGLTRPELPRWTAAVDGRVDATTAEIEGALVDFALSSPGEASQQFAIRWLREKRIEGTPESWVWGSWAKLAAAENTLIRAAAIERLGRHGGEPQGRKILLERIARETNEELRVAALNQLEHPGEDIETIIAASRSMSPNVRRAATRLLQFGEDSASRARLEELSLDNERKVKKAAKKALRKRNKRERNPGR
ncbi:MAG: hypothetical protein VX498_15735 [Myxococcota bacterium]|nr:hypothetical protein [Myxococcota bacterium]